MAGSEGYSKAADFIADQLSKMNLKPAGDYNYFQKLKVEYNEILAPEHLSVIRNGKSTLYKLGPDYVYRGFTGAGKLGAPVVFCGYGIAQPELGYNDYDGIDVREKVVMVFRYNPKWNLNGKPFLNDNPREKAIVAAKHGAVAILFVSFPNDSDPQKPIGSVISGKGEQMLNFPEIHVGLNVVSDLFEGTKHTLKELQTIIDSTKKPSSLSLKIKSTLKSILNIRRKGKCTMWLVSLREAILSLRIHSLSWEPISIMSEVRQVRSISRALTITPQDVLLFSGLLRLSLNPKKNPNAQLLLYSLQAKSRG